MMNSITIRTLLACMVMSFVSCIDPYNPPQIGDAPSFLVVDGFVDTSTGEGSVQLSQTIKLSDGAGVPYVNDASMVLELKQGISYPFMFVGDGTYTLTSVFIPENEEARIRIVWNGKTILSRYVVSQQSPPIDSVTWRADPEGVNINISAHDTKPVGFYRWKYVETYEYVSAFQSSFIYDTDLGEVVFRKPDQDIFHCWKTASSTNVLLGSTKGFNENRIDKINLIQIPATNFKLKIKYSVLVNQYAISKEEYDFWSELKKSTETVGSIFDPLPSRVVGNLYVENDATLPVLGFFSMGMATSERIFIKGGELPYRSFSSPFSNCLPADVDTLAIELFDKPVTNLLITNLNNMMGQTIGYTTTAESCIDCRKRNGGVNKKPDFWD